MKLLPFTVSVNAAPPAVPEVGDMDVTDGIGLLTGGGGGGVLEDEPPPHPESTQCKTRYQNLPRKVVIQLPEQFL